MTRPKIKPSYNFSEKLVQAMALFSLIGLIALTVSAMPGLPEKIPTHFGANGSPDDWGGKGSLLLLPMISAVLYVPLTILERFPWVYNYVVEITEENAARQYRLARETLEWLKLITTALFFYLQWQTVQAAKGLSDGLGAWFLPVFLLLLFGVMGVQVYKMVKAK